MTFTIRPAVSADIEELLRLRKERTDVYLKTDPRIKSSAEINDAWREAALDWMKRDNAIIIVADRENQLIGYMVAWVWHNPPLIEPQQYGLVSEMSVDGHCKQGGVGIEMLKSLAVWFNANHLDAVEVRVPRQHPIEQAFWRAVGAKTFIDHMYYKLD